MPCCVSQHTRCEQTLEFLIRKVWAGAQEPAFVGSCQAMLMLWVWGPTLRTSGLDYHGWGPQLGCTLKSSAKVAVSCCLDSSAKVLVNWCLLGWVLRSFKGHW